MGGGREDRGYGEEELEGEMITEDRRKGASILRNAKPLDEKATMQMRKALKKW